MPKFSVPIARTNLTDAEIGSVLDPLKSGWLVQGPKVKEFEEKWSDFTGSKNSIAVTSCTAGLHISLAAMDFGPGDEAIVPAFTWISTANVVEHLGGKVVFCDISLDSFNIDVDQIESKISNKTKAILPVHLFGYPAEMKKILEISKKYNLAVIEDAACGFGSEIGGKHVGAMGDSGCFSFHPRKAITTGEGGMITTNDNSLAEKMRKLRDHGASISDLQRHVGPKPYLLADHPYAGFNQRMTDIQASLGSEQMNRAHEIVNTRKNLAKKYLEHLGSLDWLEIPVTEKNNSHGYQSFPTLFKPEAINLQNILKINDSRNRLMTSLLERGISTRPATHAVHMLEYYKNKYSLKPEDFPNAYIADHCSISFPLFDGLREEEQEYVIEEIKKSSI